MLCALFLTQEQLLACTNREKAGYYYGPTKVVWDNLQGRSCIIRITDMEVNLTRTMVCNIFALNK